MIKTFAKQSDGRWLCQEDGVEYVMVPEIVYDELVELAEAVMDTKVHSASVPCAWVNPDDVLRLKDKAEAALRRAKGELKSKTKEKQ